jgi:hypothetical protein
MNKFIIEFKLEMKGKEKDFLSFKIVDVTIAHCGEF